jgi:DNA-binding CsgD family transcriptional regulator
VAAIKAGAADFLEKPVPQDVLLTSVRRAIRYDAQLRAAQQDCDAIRARLSRLSPREREILDLILAGCSNKLMAASLGVASKTIEFHRAHLMAKMEAGRAAELIGLMFRWSTAASHEFAAIGRLDGAESDSRQLVAKAISDLGAGLPAVSAALLRRDAGQRSALDRRRQQG